MGDYFEIDFQDVESKKSGDAILVRYSVDGITRIHIVDGGYKQTGKKIVENINKYYGNPKIINAIVVTHPDQDHVGGLESIIESFKVEELWMLRPWLYADEIIDRFARFTNVENLKSRLKELYSSISNLEKLAESKGIKILEPFQGKNIGNFKVLWPSKTEYLNLIVESEKTPEQVSESSSVFSQYMEKAKTVIINFVKSAWGKENFPEEGTSAENEMSIIQYANLCDEKILLTGDAGRKGLIEAANYLQRCGIILPGIDRFQIPHHGSRRNVNTEVLDKWLGKIKSTQDTSSQFSAIVSAAKADEDHPRKAVIRAFMHRGAKVISTEGKDVRTAKNAPDREGWTTAAPLAYPDEEEAV